MRFFLINVLKEGKTIISTREYIYIYIESRKVVERWKRRVAFTNSSSLDYTLFSSLVLATPLGRRYI